MKEQDQNLDRLCQVCHGLKDLADQGQQFATDNRCLLVYGILRDYAFHLEQMALDEVQHHKSTHKTLGSDT